MSVNNAKIYHATNALKLIRFVVLSIHDVQIQPMQKYASVSVMGIVVIGFTPE